MADELSVSYSLSYTKGNDAAPPVSDSFTLDVSGTARSGPVQQIPVSGEAIVLGEVTTIGVVVVKNLDATNFITCGLDSGNQMIKIKAGESYPFRLNGNTLIAMADTAAVWASVVIYSD